MLRLTNFKRTMKAIIILLFCIGNPVLSQTIIKLKTPQQPRQEYIFANPADTQFVSVWHLEDMGQWGSLDFKLKLNIPDGAYNIYIDNDLVLKGFVKNGLQDSIWSRFLNSKLSTATAYLNGQKVEEISYFDSGNISNKSLYENGEWISDINYYESGCIRTKLTRNGNESIKEEFPDCSSKKRKRNKKKNYCRRCKVSEPHHRHTRDKEVPF